jgi:hypothetical protein
VFSRQLLGTFLLPRPVGGYIAGHPPPPFQRYGATGRTSRLERLNRGDEQNFRREGRHHNESESSGSNLGGLVFTQKAETKQIELRTRWVHARSQLLDSSVTAG